MPSANWPHWTAALSVWTGPWNETMNQHNALNARATQSISSTGHGMLTFVPGRWPIVIAWLLVVLALTGCVSGTYGTKDLPPAPIPASLLVACPEVLPPATGDDPESLMANHRVVAEIYHTCAARQAELALVCIPVDEAKGPNTHFIQRFWWWLTRKNKQQEGRTDEV